MEPVKWISPFYYYSGNSPMINGLELLHVVLPLVLCSLTFALAYVAYQRRDLRL
jgi:ABC-2 type transport system permease protein